jgi:hypothetical protein
LIASRLSVATSIVLPVTSVARVLVSSITTSNRLVGNSRLLKSYSLRHSTVVLFVLVSLKNARYMRVTGL